MDSQAVSRGVALAAKGFRDIIITVLVLGLIAGTGIGVGLYWLVRTYING